MPKPRPTIVVAGLGDTGVLIATRLARTCRVVGVSTRPGLVSGQELGTRLTDLDRWRRTYRVPYARFRRLDAVDVVHGRIAAVNLGASQVDVESADGRRRTIAYDALVIATGVSNGFWRTDRVETMDELDASMTAINTELARAATIAVVGGGATGVSVADNLARTRTAEIHLFHTGDLPLPGFHPSSRRWIARRLADDGVVVHPDHRAVLPPGFTGERLSHEPIEWSSGQEPFTADVVLWAVGKVRPHTDFLPIDVLDTDGFVRVDDHLRVEGCRNVFAVGDVAASDPLRSSARNWGHRVVVANVRRAVTGRGKERTFKAAPHRWGSILGLQPDGLTVIQPNGKRVRFPRWFAERFLLGTFVQRLLYGGLRRDRTTATR